MKVRLFLLLAIAIAGIGTAQAQQLPCVVASLGFPLPTPPVITAFVVPPGTCIQTPGAQGRLRWDNNGSRALQLFDTDDGGKGLWCAHLHDGGNSTPCARGNSFCLQSDGNAVIYAGAGCTGEPLWASHTVGRNTHGELMEVADFGGSAGEKALIFSRQFGIVWTSNSSDPN